MKLQKFSKTPPTVIKISYDHLNNKENKPKSVNPIHVAYLCLISSCVVFLAIFSLCLSPPSRLIILEKFLAIYCSLPK